MAARLVPFRSAAQMSKRVSMDAACAGSADINAGASAAAAAGINRGDLIQEINHKPVTSASQYKQLMSGASGQPILLLINRGGITSFVVVEAH